MRLILLAAALALAGCSLFRADGEAGSDYEDAYRYTAYDEAGEAVVAGTLYVVFVPSDVADEPDGLQGRWELDARAEGAGPQDGEGTLLGTAGRDGLFSINLHPSVADDNVLLSGRFEAERARMEGTWSHSTLRGVVASGPFEAVRTHRATRQHVAG